jgi:transposase-like protein
MREAKCPICEATFTEGTTERNLARHVLSKHGKYICMDCGNVFNTKYARGAHKRWGKCKSRTSN